MGENFKDFEIEGINRTREREKKMKRYILARRRLCGEVARLCYIK